MRGARKKKFLHGHIQSQALVLYTHQVKTRSKEELRKMHWILWKGLLHQMKNKNRVRKNSSHL